MYVSRIAASMWRSRWACLLLLALSSALAIWLTHDVSFHHRSLRPRHLSFGVAQTSLLVDVGDSPLADSTVLTLDIDTLANDFAQMMGSGVVLDRVAKALGTSATRINAQSQLIGDVSVPETEAGEAQAGNQLLDSGRNYSILARVDESSFVVQLFTQAPTGAKAILMANVAARSLTRYISKTVSAERVPKRSKIVLRQIDPATGGTVDSSLPDEAAVLLSLVFFILFTTALLTTKRWRRVWKADRAVPPGEVSLQQ
jgi:hypothetical protein